MYKRKKEGLKQNMFCITGRNGNNIKNVSLYLSMLPATEFNKTTRTKGIPTNGTW